VLFCMYVQSIHPFRERGRGYSTHELGFALKMRPNESNKWQIHLIPTDGKASSLQMHAP
jgi:hypothetical protein